MSFHPAGLESAVGGCFSNQLAVFWSSLRGQLENCLELEVRLGPFLEAKTFRLVKSGYWARPMFAHSLCTCLCRRHTFEAS